MEYVLLVFAAESVPAETGGFDPLATITGGGRALLLRETVAAIHRAAEDDRVAGLIARVPILAATQNLPYSFHQLGIGFDRGGIMIGPNSSSTAPANNSYNMNPFLALWSGPGVSTMQPGYIIQNVGRENPGVVLGLNSQNTNGFSFQQLASNGGLPPYCNTPGMNCPLNWSAQNGSISITTNGQTYDLGSASQLPDSGISYMIVNAPGNTVPVGPLTHPATCSDGRTPPQNCLASGKVEVYLPGQTKPAYTFTLGDTSNPSVPFGEPYIRMPVAEAFEPV